MKGEGQSLTTIGESEGATDSPRANLCLPTAVSTDRVCAIARSFDAATEHHRGMSINLGLDRINHLLANLPAYTRSTHTNGKGSVSAMLSSILHASAYRVGRFNSPHLVELTDSIAILDNLGTVLGSISALLMNV